MAVPAEDVSDALPNGIEPRLTVTGDRAVRPRHHPHRPELLLGEFCVQEVQASAWILHRFLEHDLNDEVGLRDTKRKAADTERRPIGVASVERKGFFTCLVGSDVLAELLLVGLDKSDVSPRLAALFAHHLMTQPRILTLDVKRASRSQLGPSYQRLFFLLMQKR
jgi:hypothetical protein